LLSSLAFNLRGNIFQVLYKLPMHVCWHMCVCAPTGVGGCLRERESTLRKAQAMLGSSCGNTKALQSHFPRRGKKKKKKKKPSSKHLKILIITETEVPTSSCYLGYLLSLIDVFLSSIKLREPKMAETQDSKSLGSENFALYVIWNIKHGFFKHLCTCPIIF
jgi:hypothetical protein